MGLVECETHCHTKETSIICGKMNAADLIRQYRKVGYRAVFITDHFCGSFFNNSAIAGKSWTHKADAYLRGYRNAKKEGDKIGVRVLLGLEVTPRGSSFDFLVYGIEENDLYNMEDLHQLKTPALYERMHENGWLVFHAHPFRYGRGPEDPKYYDGIEVFNAHPRHDNRNEKAVAFAFKHNLLQISGSDAHRKAAIGRGGVMMPDDVTSEKEFVRYYKEHRNVELIITCD